MSKSNSQTASQGEHTGGIPKPLRERNQWIVTSNKGPILPSTNWNNSDQQLSYHQAQRVAKQRLGEVAYALNAEDPFTIVDFDNVGSHGSFSDEAAQIVRELNTYTEISRSVEGLHSICRGARLPDRKETGVLDERGKIEVFDADRYVVLTGNQFKEYGDIASNNSSTDDGRHPLLDVQRKYLSRKNNDLEQDNPTRESNLGDISANSADVDAQDVYRTIEVYAKDGSSKAQEVINQWRSQKGSNLGFPSGSEADLSFVSNLTFWCRNDAKLIDSCFRESIRMRDKWDEVRYSDGRTYGEGTIQVAMSSNHQIFSGNYVVK